MFLKLKNELKNSLTRLNLFVAVKLPVGYLLAYLFDGKPSPHPLTSTYMTKIYFNQPLKLRIIKMVLFIKNCTISLKILKNKVGFFLQILVFSILTRAIFKFCYQPLEKKVLQIVLGKNTAKTALNDPDSAELLFTRFVFKTPENLIEHVTSKLAQYELFGEIDEINRTQKLETYWFLVGNADLKTSVQSSKFFSQPVLENCQKILKKTKFCKGEGLAQTTHQTVCSLRNLAHILVLYDQQSFLPIFAYLNLNKTPGQLSGMIEAFKIPDSLETPVPIFCGRNGFTVFKDEEDLLPSIVKILPPITSKQRCIYFNGNDYYFFNHLSPMLNDSEYFSKIITYDPLQNSMSEYTDLHVGYGGQIDPIDQNRLQALVFRVYFSYAVYIHGYGDIRNSVFYPTDLIEFNYKRDAIPYDYLMLRAVGVKFGASMAGCVPLHMKSDFRKKTGICLECKFNNDSNVCSDQFAKNSYYTFYSVLDIVANEGEYAFGLRDSPKSVYQPFATGINMSRFNTKEKKDIIPKETKSLKLLHAVGNLHSRSSEDLKNSKGTFYLKGAVDKLNAEGLPITLDIVTGLSRSQLLNKALDYDAVVDQLVYGRLGAFSREIIGAEIPLITAWDEKVETPHQDSMPPLINANFQNIEQVLRQLLSDKGILREIRNLQRDYFNKHFNVEATQRRFKHIVENVILGSKSPRDSEREFFNNTSKG